MDMILLYRNILLFRIRDVEIDTFCQVWIHMGERYEVTVLPERVGREGEVHTLIRLNVSKAAVSPCFNCPPRPGLLHKIEKLSIIMLCIPKILNIMQLQHVCI